MQIMAYDPFISQDVANQQEIELASLEHLLKNADYITIHIPLTKESYHLLDKDALSKTKQGVYIINCARGGIVDEQALYDLLTDGHIAGAALDVFEKEPPGANPLLKLDKVVYTPHLGASTKEAQLKVAIDIARQIADFMVRGVVVNAINMPNMSQEEFLKILPYISLIEKMGKLLSQLAKGRFEEFVINYRGQVLKHNVSLFSTAAIRGLLSSILGENINYVNAGVIARERNIKVIESKLTQVGDYPNLINLELKTDKENHSISGTVFSNQDARIVEIDGFHIEAIPAGHVLVVSNEDVPGVVGDIGATLGEIGINIGRMQLGRNVKTGKAISLVNVDQQVPLNELEILRKLPNITQVIQVEI